MFSLFLAYYFYDFHDYDLVFGILWDVLMRPSCQRLICIWVYSAAKFEILRWPFWRINCYLFIFAIFAKCDIPFYGNSDLIVKFLCWENGVLHLSYVFNLLDSFLKLDDRVFLSNDWYFYFIYNCSCLCFRTVHLQLHLSDFWPSLYCLFFSRFADQPEASRVIVWLEPRRIVTPRFPKHRNNDNIIRVQHQRSITSTFQNLFK